MLNKKQLLSSLCGFAALGLTTMAHAALPGYYVGAQFGAGDTHYDTSDITGGVPLTSANINNDGFAWRGFVGYQLDPTWGVEFGYTDFQNTTYRNINGLGINGTIAQYAIDATVKGILPIADSFSVYGKLGAAYLDASTSGSLTGNPSQVDPTFGVGVSYDISQNTSVDIAWNRIQSVGGDPIPSTDFFGAGIGYNFG